jgi:hypothetical protein
MASILFVRKNAEIETRAEDARRRMSEAERPRVVDIVGGWMVEQCGGREEGRFLDATGREDI